MALEDFNSNDKEGTKQTQTNQGYNFGEDMAEMKYGSPDYHDKGWLTKKAVDENLNDRSISEICEVQPATIRKWRVKYNIESGDKYIPTKQANELLITHQLDLIEGSILGDGGVHESGNKHIFRLTNGKQEYIRWIFNQLPQEIVTDNYLNKATQDGNTWYYGSTTNHDRFTELSNKWYSDGKKLLPQNFNLNSTKLLHLYIQDGELTDQYNPRITLSWISEQSAERFKEDIENCISSSVSIHEGSHDSTAFYIPSESVTPFFRFIGSSVVEDVEYKWPPEYR